MAVKKGGARITRLCTLHELLTEMFIEEIKQAQKDEIPLSSADKSVIVTFLKNNDITATADEEQLNTLREEFQELSEARREKALALINAAEADQDFTLPLN